MRLRSKTDDHPLDDETRVVDPAPEAYGDDYARDRFGGTNWGAAFFGWLVAVAIGVLLSGVVGAIATAIGSAGQVTQTEAQRQAGTIGLVAAAVLLVIMLVAYYTGGYVAGRMSRFHGGRQGVAVWFIGLVVTLAAVALGVVFGSQYNVLDRVNLPRMPIPTDQLGMAGAVTAAVVLIGTLFAAAAGSKVGHRYHHKVDRAVVGG